MTDIYLRDLSSEMQSEIIRDLKRLGKTKILKAIEDGEDVTVGKYYPTTSIKVA